MTDEERRSAAVAKTILLLAEMSADEAELVLWKADKLMGEGRKQYGELDQATDERSLLDIAREMHDELLDSTNYAGMIVQRLERMTDAEGRK